MTFKPQRWAYEPIAMKRQRDLAKFDTLRDQISPLVANGDSLSLLKAQQTVQAARVPTEKKQAQTRSWMQKIGDQVRQHLNEASKQPDSAMALPDFGPGFYDRPGSKAKKPVAQKDVLAEAAPGPLEALNAPGAVVRGVIAGAKNPKDIPGNVRKAVEQPGSFSGVDAGPIRNLPDRGPSIGPIHLTPKTLTGFGYEAATDPLSYLGGSPTEGVSSLAERVGQRFGRKGATEDILTSAKRGAVLGREGVRPNLERLGSRSISGASDEQAARFAEMEALRSRPKFGGAAPSSEMLAKTKRLDEVRAEITNLQGVLRDYQAKGATQIDRGFQQAMRDLRDADAEEREILDWIRKEPLFSQEAAYTRLYRSIHSGSFAKTGTEAVQGAKEGVDRWWTANRHTAEEYARLSGDPNATVVAIDVPTSELHRFSAANLPDVRPFSGEPHTEFFLPAEAITKSRPIQEAENPVANRIREAVQAKYQGAPIGGGVTAMSPTVKGTAGALPLGDTGIKEAIARKAEALHVPDNPLLGPEGSKRRAVLGPIVNPSANMPREVHVANNARIGVNNMLYTDFLRSEQGVAKQAKQALEVSNPTYIGPKGSAAQNAIIGTLPDIFERRSLYTNVPPELDAAKNAWAQTQLDNLNRVRAEYKGDVAPFTPPDPQGAYVAHMSAKENLDKAVQNTTASLSSRTTMSKARAYDTLWDRLGKRPDYKPELDLETLADVHANSLARMAANNTFKEGVGGLTRAQVIEQLHPNLYRRMTDLRQHLQSLRGTAGRLDQRLDDSIQTFMNSPQDPSDLNDLLANLEPTVGTFRGQPGVNFGKTEAQINAEIKSARDAIKSLRPAWEAADTGEYQLSKDTFRYHTPEQVGAINSVLKQRVDNAFIEGGLQAADELRGVALGPDLSPFTIQGALGAASHPEVLIRDGARMAHIAFGGDEALMNAVDPNVVKRYEFATGRKFGNVGAEFRREGQGLERLPVVGRGIASFNNALQRVTEYGNLKAWENDSKILQAFGHPENIADHEAANSISKFVPRLNPAETGRSFQRARLERLPVISSSFRAAPPLLAKDITSGMTKLAAASVKKGFNEKAAWQALNGREQLAIIRGAMLASTLSGVSIATAVASANANGKNPADAVREVIDPRSSRFMSLVIGNKGSIGLGGPIRSTIRGLAPGYVNGKMVPFARLGSFARGSLNPALSTAYDLTKNKDYFGNTIVKGQFPENVARTLEYGLENLNLISGAPLSDIRTGVGNPLIDTISQIGGTNFTERTPTDRLNQVAQDRFGKNFYDLEPSQKDVIKKANPGLWQQAVARGSEKTQAAEQVKAEYQTRQQARDQQLLSGALNRSDWVNAYYDDLTEKRAKLEQIYGSEPVAKPKNGVERYIQILQQAEDPQTGILDRDKVDAGLASLNAEDRAYIDRNIGLDDTPMGKVFRQVREQRRERNDLPKYRGFTAKQADDIDTLWQEVRNNARSADRLDMLRAFRLYLAQNPVDDGAVVAGVRRRINGSLRTLSARQNYDKAHPDQKIFYGSGKLTKAEIAYLNGELAKAA